MATDFGYIPSMGSNSRTELLRLKIMACHGLSKKDRYYVQINLVDSNNIQVGVPVLTECTEPTTYPCWNEMFIVKVPHQMNFKLLFQVRFENHISTRYDIVGQVEIPLINIAKEELGIKFWEIKEGELYQMWSSDGWRTLLGQRSSNQMIQLELYHGFIGTYALAASSKAAGTFAANVIYRLKKMADFKNPFNQVPNYITSEMFWSYLREIDLGGLWTEDRKAEFVEASSFINEFIQPIGMKKLYHWKNCYYLIMFLHSDKDASGYVTEDELREVMKVKNKDVKINIQEYIYDFLKHSDIDGDGKISFEEYRTMMKKFET